MEPTYGLMFEHGYGAGAGVGDAADVRICTCKCPWWFNLVSGGGGDVLDDVPRLYAALHAAGCLRVQHDALHVQFVHPVLQDSKVSS